MPRYLLNTNIISELIKPTPDPILVNWLSPIPKRDLFLSVITIGEISKGVYQLPTNHPRHEIIKRWLNEDILVEFSDRILPFSLECSCAWGQWIAMLAKTGIPCSPIDQQIAATAYIHGATLVTRNVKDFPHSNLLNPWKQ